MRLRNQILENLCRNGDVNTSDQSRLERFESTRKILLLIGNVIGTFDSTGIESIGREMSFGERAISKRLDPSNNLFPRLWRWKTSDHARPPTTYSHFAAGKSITDPPLRKLSGSVKYYTGREGMVCTPRTKTSTRHGDVTRLFFFHPPRTT